MITGCCAEGRDVNFCIRGPPPLEREEDERNEDLKEEEENKLTTASQARQELFSSSRENTYQHDRMVAVHAVPM